MANRAELSLRFLPVEALMELPKNNPRRIEIEQLARLTAVTQVPSKENTIRVESPRLHPFIEGKATIEHLVILGKDKEGQLKALANHGIRVGSHAEDMVKSPDYPKSTKEQQTDIAILRIGDLGIQKDYPTTADIIGTAEDHDENGELAPFSKGKMSELGLNLCAPETAGNYATQQGEKVEIGDPLCFAMKPIAGRGGDPGVFGVERYDGGLWLGSYWAYPDRRWDPDRRVAFALPQVDKA